MSNKTIYDMYNEEMQRSYDEAYEIEMMRYQYQDGSDQYSEYDEPSARYIPPQVIHQYVGEVINTYIPGYGRRNVYVKGISNYGMVALVILHNKPQDCISVHYSDLSGISSPKFKCD